ncbi:hypothetical protein [Spirosoma areae]
MDNPQQPLAEGIPFNPSYISIPIYLAVQGRDEVNLGASQVDVFLSALFAYRQSVADWPSGPQQNLILELIDEIEIAALDVMYTRLSESAAILHKAKHKLPPPPAE